MTPPTKRPANQKQLSVIDSLRAIVHDRSLTSWLGLLLSICFLLSASPFLFADGSYFTAEYKASVEPGKLIYNATYQLWIPDSNQPLRGIIVHQHGCGRGANVGGKTAANDLHWQALARKWNCGLLGPVYDQDDGQDCRKWCDPRNGSAEAFLHALKDLAKTSNHPEIETVPWCLWGHSGGGFWSSILVTMYPERIIGVWCRSGAAYATWEKGEIEKPTIAQAVLGVPMAFNPGAREKDDQRFSGAWTGGLAMFEAFRKLGAPVCFAPDPLTSHECGNSRYCAIPYFDACLALRLPDDARSPLKSVDPRSGIHGDWQTQKVFALEGTSSDAKLDSLSWLPSKAFAECWTEYLRTASPADSTPPSPAFGIKVVPAEKGTRLEWDAHADLESGLQQFLILRDDQEIGRVPEKPKNPFGRPIYQSLTYHDTPEAPLATMSFQDATGSTSAKYEVVVINGVGLKSK